MSIHASSRYLNSITIAIIGIALMVDECFHLSVTHCCSVMSHSEMNRKGCGFISVVGDHVEIKCVNAFELSLDIHELHFFFFLNVAIVFNDTLIEDCSRTWVYKIGLGITARICAFKNPVRNALVDKHIKNFRIIAIAYIFLNATYNFS